MGEKKYLRCKAYYEYEVVVDNKVVLKRETNKDFAEAVLNAYLEQKKHDNIYLRTIKRVRYTLVDIDDLYKYKAVMGDFVCYGDTMRSIILQLSREANKRFNVFDKAVVIYEQKHSFELVRANKKMPNNKIIRGLWK